eukprot:tig00001024_g6325.t1
MSTRSEAPAAAPSLAGAGCSEKCARLCEALRNVSSASNSPGERLGLGDVGDDAASDRLSCRSHSFCSAVGGDVPVIDVEQLPSNSPSLCSSLGGSPRSCGSGALDSPPPLDASTSSRFASLRPPARRLDAVQDEEVPEDEWAGLDGAWSVKASVGMDVVRVELEVSAGRRPRLADVEAAVREAAASSLEAVAPHGAFLLSFPLLGPGERRFARLQRDSDVPRWLRSAPAGSRSAPLVVAVGSLRSAFHSARPAPGPLAPSLLAS